MDARGVYSSNMLYSPLITYVWRARGRGVEKGKRGRKRGRGEEKGERGRKKRERGRKKMLREGKKIFFKVLGKVFNSIMC